MHQHVFDVGRSFVMHCLVCQYKHLKLHVVLCWKPMQHVDILVQIIYAKFNNDRAQDNGHTWCMDMEKKIFQERFQQALFISLLCYSTMSKLLPSFVRDAGSNLLVQYACISRVLSSFYDKSNVRYVKR